MLVLVLICSTLCPFEFCIYLVEDERAGCFTFLSSGCGCYPFLPLPRGAMGWSGFNI